MKRMAWVVLGFSSVMAAACGGDDDTPPTCSMTVSGDVTLTRGCRAIMCDVPEGPYQSFHISPDTTMDSSFVFDMEREGALTFEAGKSYSITDFTGGGMSMENSGKHYAARPTLATRDAAETVQLLVDDVKVDGCGGYVTGALTIGMVEVQPNMSVGAGRVTVTVSISK